MTETATAAALLGKLNPNQSEAVAHRGTPLLVLAGAGSGKTRVITYRVAHLLACGDAGAENILAVTFTNKAAREMKERVAALAPGVGAGMFVGTFHGFTLRLLRSHIDRLGYSRDFSIYDSADQQALLRRTLRKMGLSEQVYPLRMLASRISLAKNDLVDPAAFAVENSDFLGAKVADLYRAYQNELVAANALDFDDMLLLSVKLLERETDVRERLARRFRHLLVDEYQDTNRVQDALVRLLAGAGENLCVVGDEDQSIYRFRGARLGNILKFDANYPGAHTVKLELNYRSTEHILAAASGVVAHNRGRKGKTLYTERRGGERVILHCAADDRAEAAFVVRTIQKLGPEVRPGEVAVLMRTNAQSRPLEEELSRSRQAYVLVGGVRFYERAEIKDLLAYVRLALNSDDDVSLLRVINTPARGIGDATVETLSARARERGGSLWGALGEASVTEYGTRAGKALAAFRDLIGDLRRALAAGAGPAKLVEYALVVSGLGRALKESKDPQDEGRAENVAELVSAAREFEEKNDEPTLAGFLDSAVLATDLDGYEPAERVSLMTLHSAKGLEFRVVFMVGMEEGLLPHRSSSETSEDIEEERRLCYVGMTRAGERLYLTYCDERRLFGRVSVALPSPFLDEIPAAAFVRSADELDDGNDFDEPPVSRPGASRGVGPSRVLPGRVPGRSSGTVAGVLEFFEGRAAGPLRPEDRERAREQARRDSGTAQASAPRASADQAGGHRTTAGGWRRGAKVRHPRYGAGHVLDVEGSGDAAKLTVYFDHAGRKKLIAKFAQLTVL